MPTPLPYDSYEGEEFQPPALAPPKKVKIKAPPKPEQSQASGMTMSDVTACKSMIKKLNKEKVSLMFRAPVGMSTSLGSVAAGELIFTPWQIPSSLVLLGSSGAGQSHSPPPLTLLPSPQLLRHHQEPDGHQHDERQAERWAVSRPLRLPRRLQAHHLERHRLQHRRLGR